MALNDHSLQGEKCPRCSGQMLKNKKLPRTVKCGRCGHAKPAQAAATSDQAWFTDHALHGGTGRRERRP